MALGKNLKKKKLIEPVSEKPAKKPIAKKKSAPKKKAPKKKELIKEVQVVNIEAPVQVEKPAPQKVDEPQLNSGLPMFIAQEIYDKKQKLRAKYKSEVDGLKGKAVQFVVFDIGGESYAISIDVVKEVVPIPTLSKTPNVPAHIKGIANIRGNTYTVFDLATKFKIVGDEFPRYLMVVKGDGITASLTLSSLPTTFKTNGDTISSSLQIIEDASLDVSYIKGLVKHDERLIYYLDIIELLKNDKAIVVPENVKEIE